MILDAAEQFDPKERILKHADKHNKHSLQKAEQFDPKERILKLALVDSFAGKSKLSNSIRKSGY